MVALNRIYTRTGDKGTTGLASGERRKKHDLRVEAYGTVDETNACIGLARLHTERRGRRDAVPHPERAVRPRRRPRDAGDRKPLAYEPLRIVAAQMERLEREIDRAQRALSPLRSFVLPGGSPAAAALHLARTVCRRAERLMVALAEKPGEAVSPAASSTSTASRTSCSSRRAVNDRGNGDVLWVPGKTRSES